MKRAKRKMRAKRMEEAKRMREFSQMMKGWISETPDRNGYNNLNDFLLSVMKKEKFEDLKYSAGKFKNILDELNTLVSIYHNTIPEDKALIFFQDITSINTRLIYRIANGENNQQSNLKSLKKFFDMATKVHQRLEGFPGACQHVHGIVELFTQGISNLITSGHLEFSEVDLRQLLTDYAWASDAPPITETPARCKPPCSQKTTTPAANITTQAADNKLMYGTALAGLATFFSNALSSSSPPQINPTPASKVDEFDWKRWLILSGSVFSVGLILGMTLCGCLRGWRKNAKKGDVNIKLNLYSLPPSRPSIEEGTGMNQGDAESWIPAENSNDNGQAIYEQIYENDEVEVFQKPSAVNGSSDSVNSFWGSDFSNSTNRGSREFEEKNQRCYPCF